VKTKSLLLAAGGIGVVGLLIGLLVLMNTEPTSKKTRTTGDEVASKPRRARPSPIRTPGGDDGPGETDGTGDTAGESRPRTVQRDGGVYVVREHEPFEEGERPKPAIAHATIAQIRTEAAPLVRTCAQPLREKDPTAKGRIRITAVATSKGGRVIVHDAEAKATNVDDPDVVECVRKVFEQISFDAPIGQDEGEQKIHVPFVVP
jgi:hypothetical protein